MPDPDQCEAAQDGCELPEFGDTEVDATVHSGERISDDQPDIVVDTSHEAFNIVAEATGEAATVLVGTGGEIVEVSV